jgi:hypothetical protein
MPLFRATLCTPVTAAGGSRGYGLALVTLGALSLYYSVGPWARSSHAGLLIPGPVGVRRVVVGVAGALEFGIGLAVLITGQ